MAKHTSADGIKTTLFKDAVCPKPSAKGVWGGMGKPLEEGAAETKGEMPGVQFANIAGGEAGGKSFMKVPGSSR